MKRKRNKWVPLKRWHKQNWFITCHREKEETKIILINKADEASINHSCAKCWLQIGNASIRCKQRWIGFLRSLIQFKMNRTIWNKHLSLSIHSWMWLLLNRMKTFHLLALVYGCRHLSVETQNDYTLCYEAPTVSSQSTGVACLRALFFTHFNGRNENRENLSLPLHRLHWIPWKTSPHRMDFRRVAVKFLLNRYIVGLMSLGHMNYPEFLDSDYLQRLLRWHPKWNEFTDKKTEKHTLFSSLSTLL